MQDRYTHRLSEANTKRVRIAKIEWDRYLANLNGRIYRPSLSPSSPAPAPALELVKVNVTSIDINGQKCHN